MEIKEGVAPSNPEIQKLYQIAYRGGMQDVVDWVQTHFGIVNDWGTATATVYCSWERWQAFLKEHGLKERGLDEK